MTSQILISNNPIKVAQVQLQEFLKANSPAEENPADEKAQRSGVVERGVFAQQSTAADQKAEPQANPNQVPGKTN